MKITTEHFEIIAEAIKPFDTPEARKAYNERDIPRAEYVKDIDKRYRWDLFWAAVHYNQWLGDTIRGYADAHIDTALRQIVKPLDSDL